MMYSQVDITETFGDDQRLGPDDWIATVPVAPLQGARAVACHKGDAPG